MRRFARLGAMMAACAACAETCTWNGGASGAAWTTGENWLDGETPVAWADGSSASFGADASVSLPSSVAVSNLTTAGALAISGPNSNPASLSPSAPTLVFPGLTLDDIDGSLLMADLNGSPIGVDKPSKAYHYKRSGSSATAQFQMTHNGHLRCVKVTFTEDASGVWAQTGNKSYYVHKNDLGEFKVGEDIDTDPNTVAWSMTTTPSGSGICICNLRGAGPRVKVAGDVQFGGAVALTNVTFETTKPVSQTWSAAFPGSNSCLSVKGLAAATVEKTFGITDPSVSGGSAAWLTTSGNDHVFTNMLLSQTIPLRGVMGGSSMGFVIEAAPYHVKYDGVTMTFQLQFDKGTYIKGIKVELVQDGANVKARGVASYYHPGGTLGEDLETASGVQAGTVPGNGVKSLTLQTVDAPSRTLGGSGAFDSMAVENAQAILTSDGARPTKNFVARNGAQVLLNGGGGNGKGSGKIYTFESGSVLVPLSNMATEGEATYIFDNATLYLPLLHPTWLDGQNMIRYITLRNGARTIGNPTRSGDCGRLTILSDGTGPNVFGTGMCLYSQGNPTLYIITSADLEIPGNLYQAPAGTKDTPVVKRGAAKLTLSGNNSFGGRFTIEAGTVVLASDTALPTASPMTLKGGCTVTCGATTNSTGALTLSGNATINIGEGALSFADSHAETWAADATLNIVGTGSLSRKQIRFGTDSSGLTAAQLKQIRYNGDKVSLTGQGYLGGPQGFIIMVL